MQTSFKPAYFSNPEDAPSSDLLEVGQEQQLAGPADDLVNAAEWPESTKHEIPACGAGFHPYGVADSWQAAGFAAERILKILDCLPDTSIIWTWVRSKAYFDSLNVGARPRPIVPIEGEVSDSKMLSRGYDEVLNLDG